MLFMFDLWALKLPHYLEIVVHRAAAATFYLCSGIELDAQHMSQILGHGQDGTLALTDDLSALESRMQQLQHKQSLVAQAFLAGRSFARSLV